MEMFTVPSEPSTSEVMRFTNHSAPPPEIMGLWSFCFRGLCFNHQDGENGQRKIVGVMLGSQAKTIHFIRHAEGSSLKYEYILDINRATITVRR